MTAGSTARGRVQLPLVIPGLHGAAAADPLSAQPSSATVRDEARRGRLGPTALPALYVFFLSGALRVRAGAGAAGPKLPTLHAAAPVAQRTSPLPRLASQGLFGERSTMSVTSSLTATARTLAGESEPSATEPQPLAPHPDDLGTNTSAVRPTVATVRSTCGQGGRENVPGLAPCG
jgi:hypothetical protein